MLASMRSLPLEITLVFRAIALAVPISMAFGCGGAAVPPSIEHPLVGASAPAFDTGTIDDRGVEVPSRSPQRRATVIDFWASWCGECTRTIPALEALYREKRDSGLMVIGVSIDRNEANAVEAAHQLGASFPIVFDPGMRVAGPYRVAAIPLSFVVDRRGLIRYIGRDPESVRRAVDAVLAE
jgi:peroxiredoxin